VLVVVTPDLFAVDYDCGCPDYYCGFVLTIILVALITIVVDHVEYTCSCHRLLIFPEFLGTHMKIHLFSMKFCWCCWLYLWLSSVTIVCDFSNTLRLFKHSCLGISEFFFGHCWRAFVGSDSCSHTLMHTRTHTHAYALHAHELHSVCLVHTATLLSQATTGEKHDAMRLGVFIEH